MHPSHTPIWTSILKLDEKAKLEAVKAAGVPQLFMPAGNDHENVKAGGLGENVLGKGKHFSNIIILFS